jgi:hypothetical protein
MKTLFIGMIIVLLANIGQRVYETRCDRELRAALVTRNQAEQKYYEAALKREEQESRIINGNVIDAYNVLIQQNKGDIEKIRRTQNGQKKN